ncbi:MAG: hypothetical protein PHH31_05395 [Acidaminococcaceae bacterium]|nr:hypothetical protein [Acidaminococcaceae bacterium]MDD4721673.1 hypothetical protein [Acidaminococcaceae bacterium]
MLFKEKLNLLAARLKATNVEIGKVAGMDSSLVSRFRTGDRVPAKNSKQIYALAVALGELAEAKGLEEDLGKELEFGTGLADDAQLYAWLCAEDSGLKKERKQGKSVQLDEDKIPLTAFGGKLNSLLLAFATSNLQLAKALKVDPSMISRLRLGERYPTVDSWYLTEISAYFVAKVMQGEGIPKLGKLLGVHPKKIVQSSRPELRQLVLNWLREQPREDAGLGQEFYVQETLY